MQILVEKIVNVLYLFLELSGFVSFKNSLHFIEKNEERVK